MLTTLITSAVLALQILAPFANADDCTTLKSGVKDFSLKRLCGKTYYVAYMAGISADTTCILSKLKCGSGDEVNVETKIVTKEKSSTEHSTFKDEGKGVLSRTFKDNGLTRKQYITSFSETPDGNFKMSFVICADGVAAPTKKGIVGSSKDADYSKEKEEIEKKFKTGGDLVAFKGSCDF